MRRGLLATLDELKALRKRVGRKPFSDIHDTLSKRCALILESQPATEAQWRSVWHQGQWGSAVTAARTAQGRILDLLISHAIDPNQAYRNRAIEELDTLLNWTTWRDPCYANTPVDLCTAEAAVAAAVGLDWLWDDLPAAKRELGLRRLREYVLAPYVQAVEDEAWWYSCYHHWNAVVNGGIGLAALTLSDRDDTAARAVELAIEGTRHFLNALGSEGGWDEGTGYWGYGFRYLLLFAEALARMDDDQRIYHSRGMDVTGLFPIYFSPNGRAASFGDQPVVPLYGTFYLLASRLRCSEVTWWLDTYAFHRDTNTTGWSAAGLALLFRPDEPPAPQPDLEPLKTFNQIGWAAVADAWPRPRVYASIKSGDLSANHSQRDMNSVQLQVDGENLLTDPGNPSYTQEYLGDQRGEFYQVQARAHNTIILAEADHHIDAQGRIVASAQVDGCRWVACDAGDAVGEGVRFVRHLIMPVDPGLPGGAGLLVVDELDVVTPEKAELFWHTAGRIELEQGSTAGMIVGRQSQIHFAVGATGKFGLWSKAVKVNHHPDHYLHASAGVIGQWLFVSAFSRKPLEEPIVARRDYEGATVQAGQLELTLEPQSGHLKLTHVAALARRKRS